MSPGYEPYDYPTSEGEDEEADYWEDWDECYDDGIDEGVWALAEDASLEAGEE